MWKKLAAFLALCLTLTLLTSWALAAGDGAVKSGTCGKNLTWILDGAGTLTISGTGAMDNFSQARRCSGVSYPSTIPWDSVQDSIQRVVIKDGVTSIGRCAFYGHKNLTNVAIPESVTTLQPYAFTKCGKLTNIEIPNHVTSIGTSCFIDCTSLEEVTFPSSLTCLMGSAFSNCGSLTCVTIPAALTNIGKNPFGRCENLTAIYVDEANPAYMAVDGVLFTKDGTTLVQYPAGKECTHYTIPNGVTTIGQGAFGSTYVAASHCKLTSITIPEQVTNIEGWAFSRCDELTSVTIPGSVKKLGTAAFQGCKNLVSVRLQNGVTEIGSSAFNSCEKLSNIVVPVSLDNIAYYSFRNCSQLADIYYGGSEDQWRSIKKDASNGIPSSASIYYNQNA